MPVTSEEKMAARDACDTYHRPWMMDETFRVMKTDLEARPVYLQKQSTITGHLLVCYVTVLLTGLLQFKVLGDEYSSGEIVGFVRGFDVVKERGRGHINISRTSALLEELGSRAALPLKNLYPGKGDVDAMAKCKLSHIRGETSQNSSEASAWHHIQG